ncbi:MAG: 50S ribosomal protein L9 [Candidatus Midichloria mitochondrii]|uniref:Large ribosomal subunit protein bL9 n=1 Tax=Midichloria mitochondrii (strain IricVA) TaxID=696127 RepID=F7XUI6_MIDMI|nr:50S ribosomal protein L9 [Candidatus Midichloria mitochondrii]AEI88335.1 ribosomal protein L9 [Candidatus Midichloria mitochondrii IricVA]MDJ1256282.1 50S ribosomal protein L9 [Candidatus Midichloria mitochondrii]MDJ1288334.1 50S ribosomal protein L9 [Candidatus Midichloria mitochondrii]MDJ1298824.1 50S ribosomal protein L9 [Candidatus Midichloria mitochondrii]MDJ1313029.1 50S ribosomal protein L9 [Candidatus Midichloria mitochondrii]
MEVILLEKISGLGEIGAVVKVKEGFAKNYLIPRKKVLRVTAQNKEVFEQQKALLEQQNLEKRAAAELNAQSISNKVVSVIRQAGEDGRLYGSVTARNIAKAISVASGLDISDEMIVIGEKIKEIGFYEISITLHADVSSNIKVNVARSEQEAEAALKALEAEVPANDKEELKS